MAELYVLDDGRENLDAPDDVRRVVRGGSWPSSGDYARCASRDGLYPVYRGSHGGFRVVVSPIS